MDMQERMAKSRRKIKNAQAKAEAKPQLPEGWTDTGRTKNGKKIVRVYAITVTANPVIKAMMSLPSESPNHHIDSECPHCLGSGRYSAHKGHFANQKCYRCHGKGWLDAQDMKYLERRMKGDEPICHIVTA